MSEIPTSLNEDVKHSLRYMAEGGANVVFTSDALLGMLLRVPKQTTVKSGTVDKYEQAIQPLFPPKYLLQHRSIALSRDTVLLLQKELVTAEQEGTRPSNRHGQYFRLPSNEDQTDFGGSSTEVHGILIQDLSPKVNSEHLLEFKPKWLALGEEVPETRKRCRTCALREMRKADGVPPGRGDSNLCPLDLLSGKSYILVPALHKLWVIHRLVNGVNERADPATHSRFEAFEKEFRRKVQPLLGRLKALQAVHCQVGLDDLDHGAEGDISLAMTLRDCSVFVKVKVDEKSMEVVDVKLADLDLKATDRANREKWMKMQRRLVEEGWYRDRLAADIEKDKVVCWLSRTCA